MSDEPSVEDLNALRKDVIKRLDKRIGGPLCDSGFYDDLAALDRFEKAVAATASQSAWRPISEAPRDGRIVRVWVPSLNDDVKAMYERGSVWLTTDARRVLPTHWTDLIAPPLTPGVK